MKIQKLIRIAKTIFRTFRRYQWKFSIIIILGFLAGLSGAFGISTIIPLFSVLTGQQIANLDFATKIITSIIHFFHLPLNPASLILFMAVLFVFKGFIQFSAKYFNQKISAEYENTIRSSLFRKTLRSSWKYLLDQKIGYLERVLMRDTYVVSGTITQISSLILLSTSFIIYAVVAFKISPSITVTTCLFGAVLFSCMYPFLNKIKRLSQNIRDGEKNIAHFLNETALGVKVIKTSGAEVAVAQKGISYFNSYKDSRLKSILYQTAFGSAMEPISFTFIAILMFFYYQQPNFNIASFAVIIYLIQKIFYFVQSGQALAQDVISNVPYLQSVSRYRREAILNKEVSGDDQFVFENTLEFKDVVFSYEDKKVLNGISFSLGKGEIVGLIGSSGAGKTTIADLVMRLFAPAQGQVILDGNDAQNIRLRSWRKNIVYMAQDAFLLNDTIANNIAFYDTSLTREQIEEAAKMAYIFDFMQTLPQGLDTIVGERGVKVSAGQRQRIALARALARNPQILILDEATSALDNQSESMIQETIENLRGKVTVLVIAHRLSTIMNSDKLIVLGDGKVLEEGAPETLLTNKDSHFYEMYNITGHGKNNE